VIAEAEILHERNGFHRPLTDINVTDGVCALNFGIKFRYLLFESGGIYNNEKLNPVLFYNNIILLAKMIMLSFASLFSWIWSQ